MNTLKDIELMYKININMYYFKILNLDKLVKW